MSRLYLGVDGGQSSTKALIGTSEGTVVGRATAGPCNHVSSAEAAAKFRRVLGFCVDSACRSAALDPGDVFFNAACFGLSGGPEDKAALVREVVRSRKYKVTHDAEIALVGAHGGNAGIIAIGGTGSMIFARDDAGKTARAGGWGYLFGDEGGAFDLVRRALRAVLKQEEGWGPPTAMSQRLFTDTATKNANELVHLLYRPDWTRDRIAKLAPLITAAAEIGDAPAHEVLRAASEALAQYVAGAHRQLFTVPVPVAPIGGVFNSQTYRALFAESVYRHTRCEVVSPQNNPVTGALREAMALDSLPLA